MTDAELARTLAVEVGALLLALRTEGRDPRELGVIGDREANALILARLVAERPGDAILSEEAIDDRARCSAKRVWIVDPLDGTREYGEGRDDWAVHIGLAIDGRPALGAVALPAKGIVFCQQATQSPRPAGRLRMVVSRSRPPQVAIDIAEQLGAELVPMGSAGAKAMAVVDGTADIYLHAGGQYEWDNCAPAAVAIAAGLHASRIDGALLSYNNPDPSLPDLLICRADLAADILERIRRRG